MSNELIYLKNIGNGNKIWTKEEIEKELLEAFNDPEFQEDIEGWLEFCDYTFPDEAKEYFVKQLKKSAEIFRGTKLDIDEIWNIVLDETIFNINLYCLKKDYKEYWLRHGVEESEAEKLAKILDTVIYCTRLPKRYDEKYFYLWGDYHEKENEEKYGEYCLEYYGDDFLNDYLDEVKDINDLWEVFESLAWEIKMDSMDWEMFCIISSSTYKQVFDFLFDSYDFGLGENDPNKGLMVNEEGNEEVKRRREKERREQKEKERRELYELVKNGSQVGIVDIESIVED